MLGKAPGKSHRVGLSLTQLFELFPDDDAAERWFIERRWPNGVHCPRCGSTNVQGGAAHRAMPYRCREKGCARRFSARTGTPMEASNLGYQKWAIATYLVTTSVKGISSMKLSRDLGITQRSAWFMLHRLREAWADHRTGFRGPVEVDETFMGGKLRNMHADKRRAGRLAFVGSIRLSSRGAASCECPGELVWRGVYFHFLLKLFLRRLVIDRLAFLGHSSTPLWVGMV